MVKVSIVIPMYNAEKYIAEDLESVIKAAPFDKEIIVVDNMSSDKSADIVKKFENVILCTQPKKGPDAARNMGISKAKGDIIILVDNDLVVEEDCFVELIKYLN